jgi:hypothetical protein
MSGGDGGTTILETPPYVIALIFFFFLVITLGFEKVHAASHASWTTWPPNRRTMMWLGKYGVQYHISICNNHQCTHAT